MANIYKRETLIRAICFSSFFVAINVLASFLTVSLPVVGIGLIIFLPLTSALVEINIKDRWFPIYALATIGLSIVVTLSSIDFTLFYIVPSIFTGYIFGLSIKRGIPKLLAIFFASLIQTLLSFAFVKILFLITSIDIIDVFAKLLKISDVFLFNSCIWLLFFVTSLIQVILSFIVVENELPKFGIKQIVKLNEEIVSSWSIIGSILLSLSFAFIYMPISLLFVGFAFYFSAFVIYYQFKTKKYICLILVGVSLLIQILLYALLNSLLDDLNKFLLLLIWPMFIFSISIFHYFLKKSRQ